MVDLEDLDRYVVVLTGDQGLDTVEDLRELEGDFGQGVYPLWTDAGQSIVAFAFEPALFNEEEAREWVAKAMEKPVEMSVMDVVQAVVAPFVKALAVVVGHGKQEAGGEGVGLRSFDEIRRLVDQALEERYPQREEGTVYVYGPWIVEMGTNQAIVELEGLRYAVAYQISEDDQVMLGQLTPVDQEWVRKADGSPVMLHAFAVRLGAGDEAEDDEDDGLIWKELIHPGKWFKTDTGRLVEITVDMITEAFRAWQAGLPKYISVPADSHHDERGGDVPVESNRGFIEKLKLIGDRLFGGFRFTDPGVGRGVQVGNIADVSVFLYPNVVHPETGEKFGWELTHVLLTNDPLVQNLEPFGVVPASSADGGYVVQFYEQTDKSANEEVNRMSGTGNEQVVPEGGVALSAEDAAVYQEFRGMGLSVTDVQAMVAEREQVRAKARGLEITRVVRALEGVEEHDLVVQVEGTRHWPVVVAAVEQALKEQAGTLALSADDEGRTGLDAVVLEVVNAIPKEGRMALSAQGAQPTGSKDPNDPTLQGEDQAATDEQIDELTQRV